MGKLDEWKGGGGRMGGIQETGVVAVWWQKLVTLGMIRLSQSQ